MGHSSRNSQDGQWSDYSMRGVTHNPYITWKAASRTINRQQSTKPTSRNGGERGWMVVVTDGSSSEYKGLYRCEWAYERGQQELWATTHIWNGRNTLLGRFYAKQDTSRTKQSKKLDFDHSFFYSGFSEKVTWGGPAQYFHREQTHLKPWQIAEISPPIIRRTEVWPVPCITKVILSNSALVGA